MLGRFGIVFTLVALAGLLLAACAVQQEQQKEEAAEEAGVEEKGPKGQPKEKAQGESPFAGEHENLQSGDTAEWNEGMKITVEDTHIATNESRRLAEENVEKGRGGEGAKKSPALKGPERLIAFSWTITNDGQIPINFGGQLPCTALDQNGIELPRGEGSTAEEMANPKASNANNILEQPLEPGQTRTGVVSIPVPDTGVAEFICVHPPQRGGRPNIAQIPEAGRATWILDPAELEVRE